ncbi:MAG: helix-turn-helix domain-containing protein [Ruminococcus sp.]
MIVKRIYELCEEQNIKPNELANRSGVTPSTVYSLLDPNRHNVSVVTLKILCDGFGITLGTFFSTSDFDNLPQELK